jgi:hypothetical protein
MHLVIELKKVFDILFSYAVIFVEIEATSKIYSFWILSLYYSSLSSLLINAPEGCIFAYRQKPQIIIELYYLRLSAIQTE